MFKKLAEVTFEAEIDLAKKCVTSNYLKRTMAELPDLLKMIFQDSKIAGNITLGHTELACVINYGLKKHFLEEFKGLVKNVNHFTICTDKFHNYIYKCKQFYTHNAFYNEITNHAEKAYLGSSYMGHGDAEIDLEKLKETLLDIDRSNTGWAKKKLA